MRSPTLNVGKSRKDLIITCMAQGYDVKTVRIESSTSGWGVAGAVTLDLGITDYMTGALNKYPESISVVLIPIGSMPGAPPAAAVTPARPIVVDPVVYADPQNVRQVPVQVTE